MYETLLKAGTTPTGVGLIQEDTNLAVRSPCCSARMMHLSNPKQHWICKLCYEGISLPPFVAELEEGDTWPIPATPNTQLKLWIALWTGLRLAEFQIDITQTEE